MPVAPSRLAVHAVLVALTLVAAACNKSLPTAATGSCLGAKQSRVNAFPSGWGGGAPTGYRLGTEHECTHSGKNAGFLTSTVTTPAGFTTLTQGIKADDFRGKRVRWKGWVRHESVANYAGLWMRVDGPGETQAFDNMSQSRTIRGSSGWKEVSIVLDVRENAIGIAFGILLSGAGDVVVDDLVMEVVPMSVASTDQYLVPVPTTTPVSQVEAIYAAAGKAGVNFNFEGGSSLLSSVRGDSTSGWILSTLPPQLARPIR